MSGIYGERSQVEAGGGDIGEGGTPAIKNVKLETLQHNMGSTPTEMNDFLAMLDDKTTYSEVIQLTEPNMSSERPQSMDYNTGSELSFNGRDMIGAGSPMGSYPNSQRISNRSSRDHTLNYSEPEPGDSGELGETMDPLTAIASASISSVPGSEQHSRVPQVQRMTQQPQTTENSMQKTTLNSTSIQDFLDNIDNSQSEEQYINPYLLNKEMNGAGVGPSLFMDSGTDIDNNKTNDDTNPISENPMMLEDLTVSPQPVFSDRRRMSEVASEKVGYPSGPRGSISHQVDFWNLSSAGSSNPPLLNMSPNKSAQLQQENNSELFDLMSFKKKGRQQSLQQQKMHNPTTQQQKDLQHGDLQQTQQQQQQKQQQQQRQSAFKIDNELTQLLNAYNLSQPNVTARNANNINNNSGTATKMRTGSFNQANIKRSNSSTQEAHNRVGKQRYSMSLLDGNQDAISKLYGDMARNGMSWENAIISDDEEERDRQDDTQKVRRKSSLNRKNQEVSQSSVDATGGRFISPQLLNNDPLLENQLNAGQNSLGVDRSNLNFELNLPITNPEALIGATSPNSMTTSSNVSSTGYNSAGAVAGPASGQRRKRLSMSKPKVMTKATSPLDGEEKPFKCDQCSKTFRRSEHLKRHVRSVHSTERPFHCQFCDKKFSRSDNLSQHLKTHKKHGDITELPPPRRATNSSSK